MTNRGSITWFLWSWEVDSGSFSKQIVKFHGHCVKHDDYSFETIVFAEVSDSSIEVLYLNGELYEV